KPSKQSHSRGAPMNWAQLTPSRSLCFTAFLLAFVAGCKTSKQTAKSIEQPIAVNSIETIDYDSAQVQVKITGDLIGDGVLDLDTLVFYTDDQCAGSEAGSQLVSEFKNNGAVISIPVDKDVGIYVSTQKSSQCLFVQNYLASANTPQAPQFRATAPASPTRSTNAPGVFGIAFPLTSTVQFYSDSDCTTLVGSGQGRDFKDVGIQVTLPANQTTSIFSKITDSLGISSRCVELTQFTHSTDFIANPTFISTNVSSPSNSETSIFVVGGAPLEADLIYIYNDNACSNELGVGTATQFASTGIPVTIQENSINYLYGKAVSSNDTPSNCALLTQFIHDSLPPANPVFVAADPASPTRMTNFPKFNWNCIF
ncbi:MAG: hypothetical protein R2827_15815, partial [Bdellovibrionales bacterium]